MLWQSMTKVSALMMSDTDARFRENIAGADNLV